jgi:hypothetical protein
MGWITELGSPIAFVKVALLRGPINASLVLPGKQRGIGEQNLKVDTPNHLAKPQSFYARLESFKMVAAEPLKLDLAVDDTCPDIIVTKGYFSCCSGPL